MADDKKLNIRKVINDNAQVSDLQNLASSGVKRVKVLDEAALQRMIEMAVDEVITTSNKEERSRLLADSRKQLSQLMNQRDEVASRANLAEAGRQELIARIEKLEGDLKLRKQVDAQEEAALRSKAEEVDAENAWLRENNDKQVEEIDRANGEIRRLHAEIERLRARIAELEGRLAAQEEREQAAAATRAEEVDTLRARHAELEAQLTGHGEQARYLESAQADELARAKAEVESLRARTAEMKAQLAGQGERARDLDAARAEELAASRTEADRLRAELEEVREESKDVHDSAKAKVVEGQRELEKLREEVRALKEQAAPLLEEVQVLEPEPPPAPVIGKPGKGLDVGTVNLVSAAMDAKGDVEIRQQRNVFIDVEITPYTRAMLNKLAVPYFVQSKRMYVLGESAFQLANVLNRRTRRPMKDGLISAKEQDALPVMKLLISSILGEPRVDREVCFYSVPGDPVDSDLSVAYHRDLFDAVLTALGYKPSHVLEGHAVTFAELGEEDFTGIGVSCGGGMFNICVTYKSLPALSFSTARSGDWVDMNVAQALNIKPEKAAQLKEQGVDLMFPKNREQDAIAIYYRNLLSYNLTNIAERFRTAENMPTFAAPISIVFSGGTALASGFIELARDVFAKLDFPIPVKEIRLAKDPLNATAKGALVAAQLEMASRPA